MAVWSWIVCWSRTEQTHPRPRCSRRLPRTRSVDCGLAAPSVSWNPGKPSTGHANEHDRTLEIAAAGRRAAPRSGDLPRTLRGHAARDPGRADRRSRLHVQSVEPWSRRSRWLPRLLAETLSTVNARRPGAEQRLGP